MQHNFSSSRQALLALFQSFLLEYKSVKDRAMIRPDTGKTLDVLSFFSRTAARETVVTARSRAVLRLREMCLQGLKIYRSGTQQLGREGDTWRDVACDHSVLVLSKRGSSRNAVMHQKCAHRVSYLWKNAVMM